jgi:hypothetical protein
VVVPHDHAFGITRMWETLTQSGMVNVRFSFQVKSCTHPLFSDALLFRAQCCGAGIVFSDDLRELRLHTL